MFDDCPRNDVDLGDSPAAGGNGHPLPGPHFPPQFEPGQLGTHYLRHVVQASGVEGLAKAEDLGKVGH
jgi:hypothetical protein